MDTNYIERNIRYTKRKHTNPDGNKQKLRESVIKSLDSAILKIYKPGSRLNLRKRIKKPSNSTQSPSLKHNKSPKQNIRRLPTIYTATKEKKRLSLIIQGKEDRLDQLINNYMLNQTFTTFPPKPEYYNQPSPSQIAKPPEERFFTKGIEEFCGPELKAYKNDLEKNLKIESIRLKHYKRYKLKLLSA